MSFLLDLLCAGIVILFLVVFIKRPLSSSAASCICLAAALCAAFFAAIPLSGLAADRLMAPLVEKQAGNRLADLFSAPHLDSGSETVAGLDFTWMLSERPKPFTDLVASYGADVEEVAAAYTGEEPAVSLLKTITGGYCRALSRAAVFLLLFLLLFFLFRFIARRVENNLPPSPRATMGRRAANVALALVSSVLVIFTLGVVLEIAVPYLEHGSVVFSVSALRGSFVYEYLNRINPFLLLLS